MGRGRASLVISRIIHASRSTFNLNYNSNPPLRSPYFSLISENRDQFLNLRLFSALPFPSPYYTEDFDFNKNSIGEEVLENEDEGKIPGCAFEENASCYLYMVIFQYGSVVLFNVEDHEVDFYPQTVRQHASGLLPEMRKDDYAIKERPLLVEDMQGGPDYIVLKTLDMDSIRIIGSVIGQSITLDYFVSQVDSMVEEFAKINRAMEKTGTFSMHRKKLFQLVGKANSNLADVILKVGLFERSEIAWRDAKYAHILDYLREEYEVTQRFGNLNFKLKFVEHNIHFLQEVLQNRKSDLLEWCIIVLLSIANVISVFEIVKESVGTRI